MEDCKQDCGDFHRWERLGAAMTVHDKISVNGKLYTKVDVFQVAFAIADPGQREVSEAWLLALCAEGTTFQFLCSASGSSRGRHSSNADREHIIGIKGSRLVLVEAPGHPHSIVRDPRIRPLSPSQVNSRY